MSHLFHVHLNKDWQLRWDFWINKILKSRDDDRDKNKRSHDNPDKINFKIEGDTAKDQFQLFAS